MVCPLSALPKATVLRDRGYVVSLLANEIHVMADGLSVFTFCLDDRGTFHDVHLEPTLDGGEMLRMFAKFQTVVGADFHVGYAIDTFHKIGEPVKVIRH